MSLLSVHMCVLVSTDIIKPAKTKDIKHLLSCLKKYWPSAVNYLKDFDKLPVIGGGVIK